MNKEEIQENDILEFANGKKAIVGDNILWIIKEYYNEDLTCKTNSDYDITRIYRPTYEIVFDKNLPTR